MMLSLSSTMSTGFFVTTPPIDSHPTELFDDTLQGDNKTIEKSILEEDNKATEKSTTGEQAPDVLDRTEGNMPEDGDLEDHSGIKIPPCLSKSEDVNSEQVCTGEVTMESTNPSILEAGIPVEDSNVTETKLVLSDNPGNQSVTEEPQTSSDNPRADMTENVSLANSEDHVIKETMLESSTMKETSDSKEDTPSPFSPGSPSFNPNGDSLINTTYEKPEDIEDDPDGLASILHLRKQSIKGEEMIQLQDLADSLDQCNVTIISRRSRHRAGTDM